MENYEKRGYLNDDFKIFHPIDNFQREFGFHYHDFNKIVILISGNVSYTIEGKTYHLQPYDIVLVNKGEIHHPIVHDDKPYERIIMYISPDFLLAHKKDGDDLGYCFVKAMKEQSNVLRIPALDKSKLYHVSEELLLSFQDKDFAHSLYHNLLFLEFMIQLNRAVIHNHIQYIETKSSNEKILQILDYVNQNLTQDISADTIANTFYLNKYYIMHLFKSETGYTLGNYITNKRLLLAKELLQKNVPATQVCYDCGFKNYSTFFRAYKKCFQDTPSRQLFVHHR